MSQRISILMTCHNRRQNTIECLAALNRAIISVEGIDPKIILVDDESTDGTADAVKSAFPAVKLIRGDGNLFWNKGMIKAWQAAQELESDFYLWLNDDTNLQSDSLQTLLADSLSKKHESIICGVCESGDRTSISYSGYLLKHKQRLKPDGLPMLCDYFNGNVVLVPKHVYDVVGLLDPFYRHTLGDVDYGLRAKDLGIMSFISSKVVAVCDRHQSLPIWCNPAYHLRQRLRHFKTPLAKNPREIFYFEKRHTGLFMAIFRATIIYIRLIFPKLWIIIGKAQI
ncbi:glycosyltransferase family 2 protein [Dyadobacter arcticus]|uniref:GT2 family glycosyltransferase n=1 Tax=Dyadobacter arcticus TaxID=1078754 RepID=A0ABX0URE1_9BACT|nr:glycosyltransferase family 2 protein [Dyadobacter arcticus]NIJ54973.1 GT2 family glycosyltransferase [Dyadobacter arcticus]